MCIVILFALNVWLMFFLEVIIVLLANKLKKICIINGCKCLAGAARLLNFN